MFTALLSNNVIANFLPLILGFILGIPPLLYIIMNGFVLGVISYIAAKEIGMAVVFFTLLPHGVIEIPALSLCAAMGVGIGYKVINRIRNEKGVQSYIIQSIKIFVTRIIPLLVLAAAIETTLIYYF
jgi:stage II sporulation protein M